MAAAEQIAEAAIVDEASFKGFVMTTAHALPRAMPSS